MPKGIYLRTSENSNKGKGLSEEIKKKIALKQKGNKNSLGTKVKEETKRKISNSLKNHPCYKNPERGKKISKALKGKSRKKKLLKKEKKIQLKKGSDELKKQISLSLRGRFTGEKSSNWKGGKSKLSKIIRARFEYRQWVSRCMTRDNWTCQTCYKRGTYLQVHHKKPFSVIIKENDIKKIEDALHCKELWDINNGITLCLECHKQTDSYLSKINKKEVRKLK